MRDADTVGELRSQCAYADSNEKVVLVSKDRKLTEFLKTIRVVKFYPDTTDAEGNWNGTFKIEVAKE